jgi:chemotaxis response regulator CheB
MMTVMIADDDRLVGISLKTIIESAGDIRVPAVGYSGADAVRLFDAVRPDILLMDTACAHDGL